MNLERQWRNLVEDSDDKEIFEGFEPADIYVDKTFDTWRKTENHRNIHEFEESRTSEDFWRFCIASALNYFQCFYTEEMFTSIVNFTILNATRKRDAYPRHKGVWTDRTQNELSATPTQQSYAQYMGGVDRLDQMSRVNKERKRAWGGTGKYNSNWEVSIYNAYVLEGCVTGHQRPNKRKWDLMSFKLELAYSLIGDFLL